MNAMKDLKPLDQKKSNFAHRNRNLISKLMYAELITEW